MRGRGRVGLWDLGMGLDVFGWDGDGQTPRQLELDNTSHTAGFHFLTENFLISKFLIVILEVVELIDNFYTSIPLAFKNNWVTSRIIFYF